MTPQPSALPELKRHLKKKYEKAFRSYVESGSENDLVTAYEFGRQVFAQDVGVLDVVGLHHSVLGEMLKKRRNPKDMERLARLSGQFLSEAFSPYELGRRAYNDSVSSLHHLNELLEQEVKRLAHTVHDEAGQLLVAAHLAIADVMRDSEPQLRRRLRGVTRVLDKAERHLRQFSHELRPTILDDLGLVPAVRFLADGISKRAKLPIQVTSSFSGRLPPAVEIGLYRVVQEALTNATRHSRAHNIRIDLEEKRGSIVCSVEDDGVGFDPPVVLSRNGKKGLGLIGIQERLSVLKGTFHVDSQTGRGSKLRITVPLGG